METTRDIYSMMATGEPIKVYRKTILGKVNVKTINPVEDKAEDIILHGNPDNRSCETCFIEIWSDKELVYFLRANRKHLQEGVLVEDTKPRDTKIKKTVNNLPDEEIEKLVKAPFLKLKKLVEEMTTEAAVARVLREAEKQERPEKTVTFIRERLSEIQAGEYELEE
jgi:hypothetical protein